MMPETRADILRQLALEYQGIIFVYDVFNSWLILPAELNGSHYEILESPPTALEFMRLVHISRPVVIKGGALHFGHSLKLSG